MAAAPGLRFRVRANRAFLGQTTRYLATEAGIRQFLDIGTGIRPDPTDFAPEGVVSAHGAVARKASA